MLKGLCVWYTNGRSFNYGNFEKESWSCKVKSDLVVAKLTAGRVQSSESSYIDTAEFIRSDMDGHQSAWPLNVSTLRYLGDGPNRVTQNKTEIVEQAPNQQRVATWSIG
ncbi:hypothetical protein JX265_011687 [Neoarthrinium moseri]|uniref:Uncharacterized protein n=1 Tax=Neoarthrinium moseri TaxID=1658444 RepID=A0A9P9WC80_9PEZI|nr:hypothetical protein JX266_012718 [Neoarthrinium moseri]KAI1856440.1 hypothetical protein JX265_011687 [Neoarthrinium moseri]